MDFQHKNNKLTLGSKESHRQIITDRQRKKMKLLYHLAEAPGQPPSCASAQSSLLSTGEMPTQRFALQLSLQSPVQEALELIHSSTGTPALSPSLSIAFSGFSSKLKIIFLPKCREREFLFLCACPNHDHEQPFSSCALIIVNIQQTTHKTYFLHWDQYRMSCSWESNSWPKRGTWT